jgi:hypothetical protein
VDLVLVDTHLLGASRTERETPLSFAMVARRPRCSSRYRRTGPIDLSLQPLARTSWLLVAPVPPTVLGLCVHLAVDMGRPDQRKEGVEPLAGSITPERIPTSCVTVTDVTPGASGGNSSTFD